MRDTSSLEHAVALLAVAMTSGELLSGCNNTSSAQPVPRVTPEQPAANDVAALRRAAEVVRDWYRRDPEQTRRVLHERGLFACDETTVACIAARQVADQPAAPPTPPTPPVVPPAPNTGTPSTGITVNTRHPAARHPDDMRAPVA